MLQTHLDPERSVAGGIFDPAVPGGRHPATLQVETFALTAVLQDGTELALPLVGIQLEVAGADNDLLFCRHPQHPGRCLYAKAALLLPALQGRLPEAALAPLAGRLSRRKHSLLFGIVGGVGALVLVIWLVMQAAGTMATWLPMSVDQELGKAAKPLVLSDATGKIVTDKVVVDAVDEIIKRVVQHSESPDLPYDLTIVRSDTVNAFALPGGYMVVFTGLIEQAESPDALAAVLGHEWTHVTRRHGMQRLGQSAGTVLLVDVVIGNIAGVLQTAAELFSMTQIQSYGREHEEESDAEAVHILHRAGLNPQAVADFFAVLAKSSPQTDSGPLSWLSTHPSHEDRIAAARKQAAALSPLPAKPLKLDWAAVQAAVRK